MDGWKDGVVITWFEKYSVEIVCLLSKRKIDKVKRETVYLYVIKLRNTKIWCTTEEPTVLSI